MRDIIISLKTFMLRKCASMHMVHFEFVRLVLLTLEIGALICSRRLSLLLLVHRQFHGILCVWHDVDDDAVVLWWCWWWWCSFSSLANYIPQYPLNLRLLGSLNITDRHWFIDRAKLLAIRLLLLRLCIPFTASIWFHTNHENDAASVERCTHQHVTTFNIQPALVLAKLRDKC